MHSAVALSYVLLFVCYILFVNFFFFMDYNSRNTLGLRLFFYLDTFLLL